MQKPLFVMRQKLCGTEILCSDVLLEWTCTISLLCGVINLWFRYRTIGFVSVVHRR